MSKENIKTISPQKSKLFTVALIVALLIGVELLARVFVHQNFSKMGHQYIWDEDLLYKHRPGFRGKWVTQNFTEKVTLNQMGTRGKEVEPETPAVIVIGDSMVFGHGVLNQQTFSFLLEDQLEGYQFINAGVKGYGSDQGLILLKKLLKKITPHKVIFSINENDLVDNHVKARFELSGQSLKRARDQDLLFPKSFKFYYRYIYSWFPSRALQYVYTRVLKYRTNQDVRKNLDLSYQKRKIVQQLRYLSGLASKQGFELSILALPVINRGPEVYNWLGPVEGARLLIPEVFSAKDYIHDDLHLNPQGHQKMANYLRQYL